MVPQFLPTLAQVMAVQLVQTLLTQLWPLAQVPQSMASPQPSEMAPQLLPAAAQVVGVQQVFAAVQT
jgi:hypothetical protein